MSQHLAASALLQVAIRRQIVSMKDALELRHVFVGTGNDTEKIREQLQRHGEQGHQDICAALMPLIPTAEQRVIGSYHCFALLGDNSYAQTWLGAQDNKLVVIKKLSPTLFAGTHGEAIAADVNALKNGDHRYLVPYYDVLHHDGDNYTIVEGYRAGRNLRERQALKGDTSEVRMLTILRHAAKGLAQLHNMNRCHGNVQPSTILLDNDGRAALADYSLACDGNKQRPGWTPPFLQRTEWAAPEESADAASTSEAADIYALGCIGYWLLSGEPPFPGTPERQTLQHAGAERPDVRTLAAGVSEITAKTLLKAMQVEPAERYPHAHAFIHSLERNLDLLAQPQFDTEARIRGELSGAQAVSSLILQEPDYK